VRPRAGRRGVAARVEIVRDQGSPGGGGEREGGHPPY